MSVNLGIVRSGYQYIMVVVASIGYHLQCIGGMQIEYKFEISLCLATITLNTHMISRSKGNTINNAIHILADTAKHFASTRESTYHITSLACYAKELLQRDE